MSTEGSVTEQDYSFEMNYELHVVYRYMNGDDYTHITQATEAMTFFDSVSAEMRGKAKYSINTCVQNRLMFLPF